MRIRSIKPEFWRSSDISKLSTEDRLLFIGLWSYVDDNGVGIDKLAAIAADLFADDIERDAQETFARVSRGLQNLAEAGRIARYAVQGAQYLSVTNWGKHQRIDKPGKPRFPRHDKEVAEIRESVAESPEVVAPVTEEQGNRGTEEQGNRNAAHVIPADFTLTDERKKWAYENTPAVHAERETEGFVDYWRGEQGKKKNWETTWRNWMRRKQTEAETKGWKPTGTFDPKNWMNQQ